MKYLKRSATIYLLFLVSLIVIGSPLQGQKSLNIYSGLGLPELFNAGVRYQMMQNQAGLGAGALLFSGSESIYTVSADFYHHFGGTSEISTRRPWYWRIGLNYFHDETKYSIYEYFYLCSGIGREFNLSRRFGLEIDLGGVFQIAYKETVKIPHTDFLGLDFPVLPGFGVEFFYRIF